MHQNIKPKNNLYPFIKPFEVWDTYAFKAFLEHAEAAQLAILGRSLGMKAEKHTASDIEKKFIRTSSHFLERMLIDRSRADYHAATVWLARMHGVQGRALAEHPTFLLERRLLECVFVKIWDKLKPAQRLKMLEKIKVDDAFNTKTNLALLAGSAAWAVLSTSVLMSGFAFYTTMSVVISTMAGLVGVTLPFAAYSGASSVVAAMTISNPLGWAILGLGGTVATLRLSLADPAKTLAAVAQVHYLKVEELQRAKKLRSVLRKLGLEN